MSNEGGHGAQTRIAWITAGSVIAAAFLGLIGVLITAHSSSSAEAPAAQPSITINPLPTASPTPVDLPSPSTEPETPVDTPDETAGADPVAGPLTLDIGLDGFPVDIDTYKAPYQVGWNSRVFDANGDLEEGCFVTWTLYKNNQNISMSHFPCATGVFPHQNRGPGEYKLVGQVKTTDRRTTKNSVSFRIIAN